MESMKKEKNREKTWLDGFTNEFITDMSYSRAFHLTLVVIGDAIHSTDGAVFRAARALRSVLCARTFVLLTHTAATTSRKYQGDIMKRYPMQSSCKQLIIPVSYFPIRCSLHLIVFCCCCFLSFMVYQ